MAIRKIIPSLNDYPTISIFFLNFQLEFSVKSCVSVQEKIIKKMDVIIFRERRKCNLFGGCQLKNFMNFLSYTYGTRPIKFAYVSESGSFHQNLSIKENILLDSIPTTLSSTKEFTFQKYLEKSGNIHLIELFSKVGDIDKIPCALDNQTKKIACLIKAFLKNDDFLILENPEKYLDAQCVEIVRNAVEFESKKNQNITMIASQQEELWSEIVNKQVYNDNSHRYQVCEYHSSNSKNSRKNSVLIFRNGANIKIDGAA